MASVPNIPALAASADANYQTWLAQVQARLAKYRQAATTPPSSSAMAAAAAAARTSPLRGNASATATRNANNSPKRNSPPRGSNNATPPPASPNSAAPAADVVAGSAAAAAAAAAADDELMLLMTRREIEVLAAYHCELQRMLHDLGARTQAAEAELGDTAALAERLQVEVQRKAGGVGGGGGLAAAGGGGGSGGLSPRRLAKQQLRSDIALARRQLEERHRQLVAAQSETEAVRAEHADVRAFIARQFFPVARVSAAQKWPSQAQLGGGGGGDASTSSSAAARERGPAIVHQTKSAAMREALMQDRRRGCVPGTSIRSTTHGLTQTERRTRAEGSMGGSVTSVGGASQDGGGAGAGGRASATPGSSTFANLRASRADAAARVNAIQIELSPDRVGHLMFVKRRAGSAGSDAASSSSPSSRRDPRRSSSPRPPFRANTLGGGSNVALGVSAARGGSNDDDGDGRRAH